MEFGYKKKAKRANDEEKKKDRSIGARCTSQYLGETAAGSG